VLTPIEPEAVASALMSLLSDPGYASSIAAEAHALTLECANLATEARRVEARLLELAGRASQPVHSIETVSEHR